ncbi:MAG: monofunctional biosynthetic peptidoglycan transglycosylase [Desulfobacteraceae bacterium]|nr:MAG: monofunctional biosynthetic peptidoglycan transglycosylase [Desulfobacteraceae bacterium]
MLIKKSNKNKSLFQRFISKLIRYAFIFLILSVILILPLRWMHPPASAFMLRYRLNTWYHEVKGATFQYEWVKWDQISPNASLAVLAAEDQKFLDHNGFDYEAINEAWQKNQHSKKVRGASTISQQVAKNLYLWPGKSFFRKGLEAYFTLLIEILWPKQRIMEVYLNIAEFGNGIYGVEAASKKFFGHSAKKLTKYECALLGAVLPSPTRLHVDRPSYYVLKRQTWILREMYQLSGLEQDPSLKNK